MNESVIPIYNKKSLKTPEPKIPNTPIKMLAKIMTSNLCSLNINYISHAVMPLENNDIHVCATIIRSVYESIPKIFYFLHHPEDVPLIMCKESFDLWEATKNYYDFESNTKSRKNEHRKSFLEQYGSEYFGDKDIEEMVNKFNGSDKFTNAWYRDQVYTNKQLKIRHITYANLSFSSHANIMRYIIPNEYDVERSKKIMKALLDLSFFNLFLYTNASAEVLAEINEITDTIKFVMETQQELKNHIEMTNLYPDNPEYLKNLTIFPIHSKS